MSPSIRAIRHDELTRDDLDGLRALFDAEYLSVFGDWHPDQPYGYAPHDVHLIASHEGTIVGHVGWARRVIGVGTQEMVIAGVGGVLIAESARGLRLGERLMRAAASSMSKAGDIEFGYLGCREEVVPFYRSCGWTRVAAAERSLNRAGQPVDDPPGHPLLVFPVAQSGEWPRGDIDLRGRAW